MEIRRAGTDEAQVVADVWLRSRAASVPGVPAPVHSDAEVRDWFASTVLPKREVWVADDDGIVALLVLDGGWVDQLYADPVHTGRRIGTRLIDVAKQARPAGLELWTFEANAGARRFYERHGFVASGSSAGDNEEGAPDVRYEWRPPAAAGGS